MTFWSQSASEAKRNYKYRLTIQGKGTTGNDSLWWAKAVTLPSFDVSNTEVHHFDNRYYFPGRVTWNPVSFTLVDPISVDAAAQVSSFLANAGYQVPAAASDKGKTINRSKSIGTLQTGAIFSVIIEIVDSEDKVVEKWICNNVFIESAKYGDLAYDNDELKTIEMTIRYDYCEHHATDAANDDLLQN